MNNHGKEVVAFIEEHHLTLNPENFSVIYDVLFSENDFLRERFETVKELSPLNDSTLKSLYKDYIFQKQLHASIMAEEEVAKTLELINHVHSRLEETTQALDNIQETLEFRHQVVEDIDTNDEIQMLKDTISHDISVLIYEIHDSNLWIKYRQKMIENQLVELKNQQSIHYQDTLTGLPNKHFLKQKLSVFSLTSSSSSQDGRVFIGKITIDNLKAINKSHGRSIGDAVLRKLGQKFKNVLPDDWDLYRIDGNDFAISAHADTPMHDVTVRLIALKKTFSNKKLRSKLNDQPVVIEISVKTLTLIRATAQEDVFEQLEV